MRAVVPARAAAALAALACVFALSGCDPERVKRLEEGVSTEADVRAQFGDPRTVVEKADGTKVLEYPRQPEGWTNYRIEIGTDGKMSSLRQLLHADNFAKVQPGMSREEVLQLLGRPAKMQPWDLKQEDEWTWRFRPDDNRSQIFSVFFDRSGRALRSSIADDKREEAQAGR